MQPTPALSTVCGFDPATADHAFTIAMTDYAAFVLLSPLLAPLSVKAPGIDVRVRGMFGRSEAVGRSTLPLPRVSGSIPREPAAASAVVFLMIANAQQVRSLGTPSSPER